MLSCAVNNAEPLRTIWPPKFDVLGVGVIAPRTTTKLSIW